MINIKIEVGKSLIYVFDEFKSYNFDNYTYYHIHERSEQKT